MKIDNLKDLKAVIQLCRKQGITNIEIDNIKLTLQPGEIKPHKQDYAMDFPEANIQVPKANIQVKADDTKIATDELSPDQLLFYSSTGHVDQ